MLTACPHCKRPELRTESARYSRDGVTWTMQHIHRCLRHGCRMVAIETEGEDLRVCVAKEPTAGRRRRAPPGYGPKIPSTCPAAIHDTYASRADFH